MFVYSRIGNSLLADYQSKTTSALKYCQSLNLIKIMSSNMLIYIPIKHFAQTIDDGLLK
jgi:hypothetical protein